MIWFLRKRYVRRINEALGIELQPWQINFIFKGKYSYVIDKSPYKSLTLMLKQMLDKHSKFMWSLRYPVDTITQELCYKESYTPIYSGRTKPGIKSRNYLLRWRQVYRKLEACGLKLAKVLWVK